MSPHVMFVVSGLERGGAENQLVAVANGLADRGWRVTVLSYLSFSGDSLRGEFCEPGVTVLTLNASSGLRKFTSPIGAVNVIRRQRPDALVGFMFHGMMTSRLPRSLLGVRLRVSSVRSERDSHLRERLLGLTDGMTDAVTVQSQRVADELCRRGVTTASRVRVIPNSVKLDAFAPDDSRDEVRGELGISKDEFLWLAAGRLSPAKDYPTMLNAFAELSRGRPGATLAIAGDGPLRSEVEALVRRLGIVERAKVLGLRRDVPRLHQACDALVLSSAWEGMPVVVLEAMASRRPVVATSVASIPEMLEDGVSGLLVPPGEPGALAEAMAKLMDASPEDRQTMADKGLERVRTSYSEDVVLDQWEDLFQGLLSENRQ